MMKKGFTLIELLVVIGMLAIITGAASSTVMRARTRSQMARAETETREITNAILAYENWDDEHNLDKYKTSDSWEQATEDKLMFILGKVSNSRGNVPVLYNAAIARGAIRDPWGTAYEFKIVSSGAAVDAGADQVGRGMTTFMYLPNMFRLTEEERK